MSDLDIIKKLEKVIGEELPERDKDGIYNYPGKGYSLSNNQNVIGLDLTRCNLNDFPI